MGRGEELGGVLVGGGWGCVVGWTHVNEGCGDDDTGAEVLGDEEGGFGYTHAL